ncbi:hypothetical protein SAMN04487764_1526 [Gillisia sp. Hel1_33_143]|uniref:hypothetical protein n=1 Tax=Gillisia sp. Hel1_33_143 TaxID=1336796 RepID=UPI00087C3CC3|nr:hypothetical protein [Gillisia sp. Hel1_33_143]SDS13193.1 hypothetical protein SAMN04487764_1526 [Gillisia sp. Hel1_33_143]
MSKELELEYQYEKYLKITGLTENQMHPIQRQEIKRAFFGACGQMLVLFRDEISAIEDEDRAVLSMEDLVNQVEIFWKEEIKKSNFK